MANTERLREAVAWAEAESKKPLAQSCWNQAGYVVDGAELGRSCGTAYCIAGWVYAQDHTRKEVAEAVWITIHEYAARELGLDVIQADLLFSATNRIERIRRLADRFIAEVEDAPVPAPASS